MKLDEYLKSTGLTALAFSQLTGVSRASLSRIQRGTQTPSWATMKRIMAESKGKITPDDLMP